MTKIIALDAGHGKNTPGKRCLKSLDANQTREWFLNDRIMDKVQDALSDYDCKVIRTDDTTGKKDISLSTRVKTANNAKANIFISMHANAGLNGRSGGGTQVYYCSTKEERKTQAIDLYYDIVNQTRLVGNRNVKVINNNFYVTKNTKMPAFLVENGFMDSPTDVPIILTEDFANKTAIGVVYFIVKELGLKRKQAEAKVPVQEIATYYLKYTGAKTTLTNALASLKIDSSYAFRKKIAAANNIVGYIGSASQNIQMYNLLCSGLLKRA